MRESGGQYSHAAVRTLMAFAALGKREKVYEPFRMVQSLSNASDAASVQVYKVEPYMMVADVYANESHKGRGGWTWYTCLSGWLYRFIIGSLLGMEFKYFKPCFPMDWPFVTIDYRFGNSIYKITVYQTKEGADSWWKTGITQENGNAIQ